ncbi:MAG TPA: hypothetical protein VJN69_02485 [Candidatus Acidoferrales bacterium]|nr:hypothetical protein [Candidatus Acidoferrales bacterium]
MIFPSQLSATMGVRYCALATKYLCRTYGAQLFSAIVPLLYTLD